MNTHHLHTLSSNWHWRRFLGLALTLFVFTQAILLKDALLGVVAFILSFQVVTNTGCFGSKGCAVPAEPIQDESNNEEIRYEEVN